MKKLALLSLGMLSVLTLVGCGGSNKLNNGVIEFEGVPVSQEALAGKAKKLLNSINGIRSFETSLDIKKEKLSGSVKYQEMDIKFNSDFSGKLGAGLILGTSLADTSAFITTENLGGTLKLEGIPSIGGFDLSCDKVTTGYYLSGGKVYAETKNDLFQGLVSNVLYSIIGSSTEGLPETAVKALIAGILNSLPEKAFLEIPDASQYKIDTSKIDTSGIDFDTIDGVFVTAMGLLGDSVKYKDYGEGKWGLNFRFDVNSIKNLALTLGAPEDIVNEVAAIFTKLSLEASFKFDAECRPIFLGSRADIKANGKVEGADVTVSLEEEMNFNFAYNSLSEIKVPEIDKYQEVDLSGLITNDKVGFLV